MDGNVEQGGGRCRTAASNGVRRRKTSTCDERGKLEGLSVHLLQTLSKIMAQQVKMIIKYEYNGYNFFHFVLVPPTRLATMPPAQ
jgi:hypothetical protein